MKKIVHLISTFFTMILAVLAIFFIVVRVIGYTPYVVLSPSMSPIYPVGSLIYVKPIERKEIVTGDDITFVYDEHLKVVTHRVIEISEDQQYFGTQGIANTSMDNNPVYYQNILGKVYFCIPYLGYVAKFISSSYGLLVCVSILLLWCIGIYIVDKLKKGE